MAKTKAGKKFIRVKSYFKSSGIKVRAHCRSTYNKKY